MEGNRRLYSLFWLGIKPPHTQEYFLF